MAHQPLTPPPRPPARRSARRLPPYRHVPGLTPHPVRDPAGHSHGVAPGALELSPEALVEGWMDCEPYLYGVDLFNRAYFWEAHEAWEEVWNAVGHRTPPGRLLQGMIQVSAALLKRHLEVPRGAVGNFRKAGAHFDAVEASLGPTVLGLDLRAWRSKVAALLEGRSGEFPYIELVDGPGTASGPTPSS